MGGQILFSTNLSERQWLIDMTWGAQRMTVGRNKLWSLGILSSWAEMKVNLGLDPQSHIQSSSLECSFRDYHENMSSKNLEITGRKLTHEFLGVINEVSLSLSI